MFLFQVHNAYLAYRQQVLHFYPSHVYVYVCCDPTVSPYDILISIIKENNLYACTKFSIDEDYATKKNEGKEKLMTKMNATS